MRAAADRKRRGGKDAQVRAITAELDKRMDDLRATVGALEAILDPPGAGDERLVADDGR
jgi:hypothetical protein